MSSLLFDRTWDLSISKSGVKTLLFNSQDNTSDKAKHHKIVFSCRPFSGMGQPSYLEVQIYNLDQDSISQIEEGDTLELSIGYSLSGDGVIFKGQIYSFYGSLVATPNDVNYVFNLYCYFEDNQQKDKDSSSVSIDLPKGTISSQAAVIAKYYGYQQNLKNILSSPLSQTSPDIKIVADNIDGALLEFYKKTKYYLMFDIRNKTYNLMAAQPTIDQRNEISSKAISADPVIKIDNNTGMVGYPHFDSLTHYLKVRTLIRHDLDYFSSISVDLSNSVIKSIDKTLSQQIVVDSRQYQTFTIISMSYEGDTRGNPWYQDILAVGQL